jgi:hypothetical protein
MHARLRGSLAAAALAMTVQLSASCSSQGDRFTINELIDRHERADLVFAGSGCAEVSLPGAGGADDTRPRAGDFNFSEGPDGDSFLVRVFSDDELLTSRRYDETMLASGKVDEFSVTTHLGVVYTLRYWGGLCPLGADGSIE